MAGMLVGAASGGGRGGGRELLLGRCAGVLFLAGAVASAPANQLLTNPEPGWEMHLIDLLALVSGLICLAVPWDRIHRRWLHVIPPVASIEIVITVTALGSHGDVYLWFFVLGSVFTGYAFRRRRHVLGHMLFAGAGFVATAINAAGWDNDALVRALVGVPTLMVAAGAVTWLREGLEQRERTLRRLIAEREHESRTDSLTGLGNRRALLEALDAALAPGSAPSTFALFDLDGFKLYNDRFGHPAGDALLQRLARSLREAIGARGAAFRLGGDEFCVLVDAPGVEGAAVVAACSAALTGEVSPSCGSAALPGDAAAPSVALSVADRRMYADKQRRRLERGMLPPFVAGLGRSGSRSRSR